VLLRCVDEGEANNVLNDMHKGLCGGHYTAQTTAHKILRAGYWWPTLFSDAQRLIRKCDPCQRFSGKLRYEGALPLRTVTVDAPFQQWGIDFLGEIAEKSSGGHSWILVATDYFTKWIEAIPTKRASSKVAMDFILENIIIRFGVPFKIITDNSMCFKYGEFVDFCNKYGINLSYASPYHPQGNGQVESSNKSLMKIIKRIVDKNKRAWDSKLKLALWADRVTVKKAIGRSPFELVYGALARLPINNLLPVYKFIQENDEEIEDSMTERIN